ncbi:MAG: PAS domain-containing sensor histidine kinase [Chloroflexota bacterium]
MHHHGNGPPEILLNSAMNALPSHIAILDEWGTIIGVNEAWRRFGDENDYDDTSYGVGLNYIDICEGAQGRDADIAGQVGSAIRNIGSEHQELFRIEYPCHSPTERRWFMLQVARFDWQGEMRMITAHQNVTDLKVAQQAYANSQKRLQAVVDTVVDGIFTCDEDGNIVTMNPAVCEIFGYTPEELAGRNISDLLVEPYSSQYHRYLKRHRQVHSRRYAEVYHEVSGIRKNGTHFPMYIATNRAYIDRRWLFTGIVQDLTPRKRIEQESLEKERLQVELENERDVAELKNRFMSMISHELRTPLSVIMLSSDFLKRYSDRMPEAEKMETISTIQTQIRHLEGMVDDVSALSRADSLDVDVHTEKIDIVDFCRDITANAQMIAADTHRIRFMSDANCPLILGDSKLLRQAFTNLINNAIKYSDHGTTVHFELRCKGEEITISIADEGIGIPEADQSNLFEPFHRAKNVGVRQGTGLGLAVTRRAVEMHGGSITFESVENAGTTFTIVLPMVLATND